MLLKISNSWFESLYSWYQGCLMNSKLKNIAGIVLRYEK
jgi:hypothetical protein